MTSELSALPCQLLDEKEVVAEKPADNFLHNFPSLTFLDVVW